MLRRLASTGGNSGIPKLVVVVLLTAVVAAGSLVAVGQPASGAGSTTVSLSPSSTTVDTGKTTTVDVVVASADGGVKSYEFTVEVADPAVSTIESVDLKGNPGFSDVDISDNGSSVTVTAAAADTTDSGAVTIASLTVRGNSSGETELIPSVETLGDEDNNAYTVAETTGASVSVEPEETGSDPGSTAVRLSPDSTTVDTGETTTIDAIVASADGGVKSYEFTVEVGNLSVASIRSVDPKGDPDFQDVDTVENGSSVTVTAAAADTADTGAVTIASLTLEGATAGETDLSLSVDTLGDESNDAYTVTGENGATLTVEEKAARPGNEPPNVTIVGGFLPGGPSGPRNWIEPGETDQLIARATDPDGEDSELTVSWTQLAGPDIELRDTDTDTPEYTAPPEAEGGTTVTVRVTAEDSAGASDTDTLELTLSENRRPGVSLGPDRAHEAGTEVTISGGGVDPDDHGPPDDNLTTSWSQLGGPEIEELPTGDRASFRFTTPDVESNTTVTLKVTVTDPVGASATDVVNLTITPEEIQPHADAGPDRRAAPGESVTLNGSVSDPNGDPLLEAWTQLTGPSVDWRGGTTDPEAEFVVPEAAKGTKLVFRLEVIEEGFHYRRDTDNVTITVESNEPPTATFAAGVPIPLTPGKPVAFNASESSDPDGSIQSYAWDFGDGSTAMGEEVSHAFASAGTFTVELTVTDDDGATDVTSMQITVEETDIPAIGKLPKPPTDPDDDGTFEDVNGDGSVNVGDVQAIFANRQDPVVQNNTAAFDFNDDGSVNVGDVQALFASGTGA